MSEKENIGRKKNEPALDPMSPKEFEARMRSFIRGESTLGDLYQVEHEELYEMLKQGQTLLDSGRYEDAEKVFKGLIALDSTEANFHFALAAVYQHQDKLKDALLEYERTVQLNQTDLAARTNMAEVLMMTGDLEKAVGELSYVIKHDPEGSTPHTQRAQVLAVALKAMAEEQVQKKSAAPKKSAKKKKTKKK